MNYEPYLWCSQDPEMRMDFSKLAQDLWSTCPSSWFNDPLRDQPRRVWMFCTFQNASFCHMLLSQNTRAFRSLINSENSSIVENWLHKDSWLLQSLASIIDYYMAYTLQSIFTAKRIPQFLIQPIAKYAKYFPDRNNLIELCNETQPFKDVGKSCHSRT